MQALSERLMEYTNEIQDLLAKERQAYEEKNSLAALNTTLAAEIISLKKQLMTHKSQQDQTSAYVERYELTARSLAQIRVEAASWKS